MAFTNLRDATREDWDRIDALDAARTDYAEAPLALLESLKGGDGAGYTLNPYDHSRQAATRALRAGESSQFIVSILFHDAADRLAPANHGQIAAELLRPFVVRRPLLDGPDARAVPEGELHPSLVLGQRRPRRDARAVPRPPCVRADPALLPRLRRDVVRSRTTTACRSRRSCPRSARCSTARIRSRRSRGAHRDDCSSRASPPESAERPGECPALVVAGSSSGRTQRRIHRIGAEQVLGAAVGKDRLDLAAAGAELVDLRCEMRAPLDRRE